jgi:hypothetical protein
MHRTANTSSRSAAAASALAATLLLCAGCGAAETSSHVKDAGMGHDGSAMSMTPKEMAAMSTDRAASSSATMVCSGEIAGSVQRTLQLDRRPVGTHHWSARDRMFSCTYPVAGGHLDLSVQDATGASAGTAHFATLRRSLPGAKPITGMEALGFPAFSTRAGDVLFLKDGKTLRVDPSRLPRSALPRGLSAEDAAYGVAASVIACWKE